MFGYSFLISLFLSGQLYAAAAGNAQDALFEAAKNTNKGALKSALEAGANPLAVDQRRGEAPIHTLLKQKGNEKEMGACLADMIAQAQQPVVREDAANRIRKFLGIQPKKDTSSINLNVADVQGNTPLSLALKNNHRECLQMLKRNGVNVNDSSGKNGSTLHSIVQDTSLEKDILEERLRAALTLGVDINALNVLGRSALIEAVLAGNNDAVNFLLMYSPEDRLQRSKILFPRDTEIRDKNGKRAIDYAREQKELEKLLLNEETFALLEAASL